MSRQARLGLVVLTGLLAAVGFLFIVAGQDSLFSRRFSLNSTFTRVAGLKVDPAVARAAVVKELADG